MIFASVGSVLPFDRLAQGVDDWAGANPDVEVILQIGQSDFQPRHARGIRIMDHAEYRNKLLSCDLFIAHVGMGSILQALELEKQMLLMPRRAAWREHTTDHQFHTANRFRHYDGIRIVDDVPELMTAITEMLDHPLKISEGLSTTAPQPMIDAVRRYLVGA